MTIEVLLDFETTSAIDLKKAGAWRYAEDVTTEILVAGFTVYKDGVALARQQWHPTDIDVEHDAGWNLSTFAADDEITFVAHGAQFEKAIWRKIMVPLYGFKDIKNSRWSCTLSVCAYKSLPLDLDGSIKLLDLPDTKDTEGSKITRDLSKPNKKGYYKRTADILKRVDAYNLQDLVSEEGLLGRVGRLAPAERQVWLLDQRINERGVKLDMPLVNTMLALVERASKPLLKEFNALTGVNPGQRDAFLGWLHEQGLSIPDLKKETVKALIGEIEETAPDEDEEEDEVEQWNGAIPLYADRALRIRAELSRASLKKLARMPLCVSCDERARGLLQYHGGHTGRWAGRLIQIQNFPTASLKDADPNEVAAMLKAGKLDELCEKFHKQPMELLSMCLRYCLVAEPDRRYFSGDFKAIELRVLLALAGQTDKVDMLVAGLNAYLELATLIFKPTVPFTKAGNPFEYDIGKHGVLGLGYGMGGAKFIRMYARGRTIEFGKQVVTTYREDWAPEVPKLWYALANASTETVHTERPTQAYGIEFRLEDNGEFLTARLPSGRKLWYYHPVAIREAMPWNSEDVRPGWEYLAIKNGMPRVVKAFGGMITGHVVQGIARDLLVDAMFKCEANDLPVALTCHDETVAEPKRGADIKAFKDILNDSPAWARQLGIQVDTSLWEGDRYKKE